MTNMFLHFKETVIATCEVTVICAERGTGFSGQKMRTKDTVIHSKSIKRIDCLNYLFV